MDLTKLYMIFIVLEHLGKSQKSQILLTNIHQYWTGKLVTHFKLVPEKGQSSNVLIIE